MIAAHNISAGYGPKPVINDISVTGKKGDFVILLGPNGCGKSTLLKTLAGLIPNQTSGEIFVGDVDIRHFSIREKARKISFLSQDRQAADFMSVADILEIGRAPYRGQLGQLSQKGKAAIESAARRTDISGLLDRSFGELSGGEKARVLLARSLCSDADVLLADEPIAALDPYFQITMMQMLKAESASGRTVVTAIHDLKLAHQFADHIWVLKDGQLIGDGAPDEVLTSSLIREVFDIQIDPVYFMHNMLL